MGARLLGEENHTLLGLIGENNDEAEIGLDQYDKNPPWSYPISDIWRVIYEATQDNILLTEKRLQVIESDILDRMDGRRMRKCLAYYIEQEHHFTGLSVDGYVESLRQEITSEVVLWQQLEATMWVSVFRGVWEENIARHLLMWRSREICWRFLKLKQLQSSWKPGEIFSGSNGTLWSIFNTKIYDD
jgi:hypothetical protein